MKVKGRMTIGGRELGRARVSRGFEAIEEIDCGEVLAEKHGFLVSGD